MKQPKCSPDDAKWMMEVLRGYGREFLIFEEEDQPNVFAQPEHQEPYKLRSRNVNPRALQNWSYLETTRSLFRERYGLFQGANLLTHCPFRQSGKGKKAPRHTDQRVFRMIVYEGMVGFTCNYGKGCPQKHCEAKERSVIDMYDLIALLDGKNLNHAKKVVAKHFGVRLGNFPKGDNSAGKKESDERLDWLRFSVSKVKVRNLFARHRPGTEGAGTEAFVKRALDLICNSPDAPYDGHQGQTKLTVLFSKKFDWQTKLPEMGASARLFVWLHWQQAEQRTKLSVTNEELSQALHVSKTIIADYKKELRSLGYLGEQKKSLSVRYEPILIRISSGATI